MTLAKVVVGVYILSTGNILLIGGVIWYYRSYTNKVKEMELQAVMKN